MYIYGVYAPYYDGSVEQTELYLEIIDQLQCLVDQTENDIPIVLMGDLNTALPESEMLSDNWYCKKPFTKWSLILYEFLKQNNMCVANFLFEQQVDYTYRLGNKNSYIDHIFIPKYLCNTHVTLLRMTPAYANV